MGKEYINQKLKEIQENTLESGIRFEGNIESPEYYNLFCQAAAKDQLYRLMGNNLCMFNCEHEGKDSIMMIFSIPINNPDESGAKSVAERVMEVVENTEKSFVTLDYVRSTEVKEDKFVYVVAVKKMEGSS